MTALPRSLRGVFVWTVSGLLSSQLGGLCRGEKVHVRV